MLFFAFGSVSEALMIYSAIPLAAVGGILALLTRGMPFSISAGIGFIALFGIAVLNGIVLIEHFKELKELGITSVREIIIKGTSNRLRPVILTALAAALGFLPMAISNGAGAEVQRPLATVVIGGLVSSTLLTMIVLPVLYYLFEERKKFNMESMKKTIIISLLLLMTVQMNAQESDALSLDEIYNKAIDNNAGLKASSLKVEEADAMINEAFSFDKTELYYHYDENNTGYNNIPLKVFGIEQDFLFPTRYFAGKKVNQANLNVEHNSYKIQKRRLEEQLFSKYYELQYQLEKEFVLKRLDSFYQTFAHAAKRRFETGETNYLEKITAQAKQKQLHTLYLQAGQDVQKSLYELKKIVQHDENLQVEKIPLQRLVIEQMGFESNPGLGYYDSKKELFLAKKKVASQSLLPDITLNYFQGSNSGINESLIGYQVGLKIPLLFSGNNAKIKASKLSIEIVNKQAEDYRIRLETKQATLFTELKKYEEALEYYDEEGENLSQEIFNTAKKSYQSGEINFFQYIQSIENSLQILLDYLQNLNLYNQKIIELNYLTM
jgi:cobalt-zinc-cadmium resistance protein CzcA